MSLDEDGSIEHILDISINDASQLVVEEDLIYDLFPTLERALRDHCQEVYNDNNRIMQTPTPVMVEYHALVTLAPDRGNQPIVTWTCQACFLLYKYARMFNRRLNNAVRQQPDQQYTPDCMRMTDVFQPPFPTIYHTIVAQAIQEETARQESRDPANKQLLATIEPHSENGVPHAYPQHL